MNSTGAGTTRPYRMRARRRAMEETGERILDAAYRLWLDHPYDQLTLEAVGERAGVTKQTVLRHFGSKDDLLVAVTDWRRPREDDAATGTDPGDVDAALASLLDRYEVMGDAVVRFLELEGRAEAVDYALQAGREGHRAWIEHAFGPHLPPDGEAREQAVLALYAATDVMVWKLLRRDFAASRPQTEAVVRRLVEGVLGTLDPPPKGEPR